MSKPTYNIILDFDDVIYPFCQGIKKVLEVEGIAGEITQWELEKDFGLGKEEFWGLVYQSHHLDTLFLQRIEFGLLSQLRRLRYAGHRLHVVTARNGADSERYCREVMLRDKVPVDSLTFTKDKGPMVDELDASFSVDDGPHNYTALDQPGHLTYLMDMCHNRAFQTDLTGHPVRRVNTMTDFTNAVLAFQAAGVQLRGEEA